MHAAVGQIVLDGVLVQRLNPFEREFFDFHEIPGWKKPSSCIIAVPDEKV
jgi:hypothetical protein